ncbi:MAG TPA: lmo0937 family membrane protein [Terriglobales bacterium]|jgi:hypothetical protein
MFIGLFALLLIVWLVCWLGLHIAGAAIHILLVLAIVALIMHFVRGTRTV